MDAAPLAAVDLPLELVVWDEEDGRTRISYLTAALAARHGLSPALVAPLQLTDAVYMAAQGVRPAV
jgi:uncharacterized protein (DUF302 family)